MKNFHIRPFSKNGCLTEEKGLKDERGEIRNENDTAYSMRELKMKIVHRARGDRQSRADSLSIALSIGAVVLTLLIIDSASVSVSTDGASVGTRHAAVPLQCDVMCVKFGPAV
jgi:hypothetical protein